MADIQPLKGPKLVQWVLVLILVVVRGLAMWIYVPVAFITWLFMFSAVRVQGKTFPNARLFITFIDEWFVWLFLRGPLRPFTTPVPVPTFPKPGDDRPRTRLTDAW